MFKEVHYKSLSAELTDYRHREVVNLKVLIPEVASLKCLVRL